MAFDVNSSLASLFSNERVQPSKARSNDKKAQDSVSTPETREPFGRFVSEAAHSDHPRPQKAAPPARGKAHAPDRRADAAPERERAEKTPAKGEAEAAETKPQTAEACDKADKAKLREHPADGASESVTTEAKTQTEGGTEDLGPGAEASGSETESAGDESGHSDSQTASGEEQAPAVDALPATNTSEALPEGGVVVAPVALAVSEPATPAAAEAADISGVALEDAGKGGATVATLEAEAAKLKAEGTTKGAVSAVTSETATAQPDEELQPGMAAKVEALREAITQGEIEPSNGKAGIGGAVSAEAKAMHKAEAGEPSRGFSHDIPPMKGGVFAEILDGFGAVHGLGRTGDLIAALDRPVAAAALAGRPADVQRPTPLQMLPVEIGMQAVRGAREFQIRLDPAELGRVDVKLHINEKGEVNASMVVERPETLQLLRRDAQTLTQAFEQAGLKQGEAGLSFSLKGEGQEGRQQNQNAQAGQKDGEEAALQAQIGEIAMRRVMIPNSSLDLMV